MKKYIFEIIVLLLFVFAFTSMLIQKCFYGGIIDDSGVLQDSIFLPLSFIFLFLALLSLVALLIKRSIKK